MLSSNVTATYTYMLCSFIVDSVYWIMTGTRAGRTTDLASKLPVSIVCLLYHQLYLQRSMALGNACAFRDAMCCTKLS